MNKINITIVDNNKNKIGKLTLNGTINRQSTESGDVYVIDWSDNNDKITIQIK